jgi:hypothetical protein
MSVYSNTEIIHKPIFTLKKHILFIKKTYAILVRIFKNPDKTVRIPPIEKW